MQDDLWRLNRLVLKILKNGRVNKLFDGTPILHFVFERLQIEPDQAEYDGYVRLIERILRDRTCDPNILGKGGRPLLSYAAEKNNIPILESLLRAGADSNLTDIKQYTALEWAIQHNPASYAIPILARRTMKTPRMLKNCQKMFESAVEKENVGIIDILLDLKLVTYSPQFRNNLTISHNLPNGFWIRTVYDPQKEHEILLRREELEDSTLASQRHTDKPHPNEYYTNYSPATYVFHGIPISIFSCAPVGVMIRSVKDPIPWWFDGHEEELTRDFSYHKGADLNNGRPKGQYWEITPEEIQVIVRYLYTKEVHDCKKYAKENQLDKHGVILDKMLCDIHFRWNEGLMRYKRKQIFGIVVDPESEISCQKAFALKSILRLNVPLYEYCADRGAVHEVSQRELIQRWNLVTSPVIQDQSIKSLPAQQILPSINPLAFQYPQQTLNSRRSSHTLAALTEEKQPRVRALRERPRPVFRANNRDGF